MQTFVLRVWTPATPDGSDVGLHGLVEHVGSGRRQTFAGGPEVLEFIADCVRDSWGQPAAGDEDDPRMTPPGSTLGGSGG